MSGPYHTHPYQGAGPPHGQPNEATDDEDSDGKNSIRYTLDREIQEVPSKVETKCV